MRSQGQDRFRRALAESLAASTRRRPKRSAAPEIMLGLSAAVLALMAVAMGHPRQTDALLTQMAASLLPPRLQAPDFEATAAISRDGSIRPDQPHQTLAQGGGERHGPAPLIDIDMGELTLRGSL
jgi:hypothetical protein